jgi:hypothetical protein
MAIDERSRHELYARLEEVLGAEEARVLMEYLPPVGWADVATKRDLDQLSVATKRDLQHLAAATKRDLEHLEERMDLKFEAFEGRVMAQLVRQTRTFIMTTMGTMISLVGVLVIATR